MRRSKSMMTSRSMMINGSMMTGLNYFLRSIQLKGTKYQNVKVIVQFISTILFIYLEDKVMTHSIMICFRFNFNPWKLLRRYLRHMLEGKKKVRYKY